jgi:hypothetical protein
LEPPSDEGGDGDSDHEGLDVAVEACGEAPPVLEAAEHALDVIALAIFRSCSMRALRLDLAGMAGVVPRSISQARKALLS